MPGETPVLAVDADPNANFHEALGVEVKETLGSMREEAFTREHPARDEPARLRTGIRSGRLSWNQTVSTLSQWAGPKGPAVTVLRTIFSRNACSSSNGTTDFS